MFNQDAARGIALGVVPENVVIDDARSLELRYGWFFAYRAKADAVVGSQGVIANKATGKVFTVGSAFPIERDLELYDRGYQFDCYDLVLLEVNDAEAALDALLQLGPTIVEPMYQDGSVWRIPRALTRAELRDRIGRLPCVFGDVALYFNLETLEAVRAAGTFSFLALECTAPKPDVDPADRARNLAESISCLMNGLAACAFPELGVDITDELWTDLHKHVVQLRVVSTPLQDVTTSPNLDPFLQALPTLERILAQNPSDADRVELRTLAELLLKPIIDQDALRRLTRR